MKSLLERFWSKVRKTRSCWLWTGSLDKKSRGRLRLGAKELGKQIPARVSWVIHRGSIPLGLWVLHKCDVPSCVNPDHLFLGTRLDNVRDCLMKGRTARGSKNGMAKLTERKVRLIRRLYGKLSQPQLRDKFGLSKQRIHQIIRRKSWKHV